MRIVWRAAIVAAALCPGMLTAGSAPEASLGLSVPIGAATQVVALADWQASPPALHLVLADAAGAEMAPVPMPEAEYAYFGLKGFAEADVDGDGDGDLLAIAEYVTGIGPTGADPFPQAMIWLREPDGFVPAPEMVADLNASGEIPGMEALIAAAAAARSH